MDNFVADARSMERRNGISVRGKGDKNNDANDRMFGIQSILMLNWIVYKKDRLVAMKLAGVKPDIDIYFNAAI